MSGVACPNLFSIVQQPSSALLIDPHQNVTLPEKTMLPLVANFVGGGSTNSYAPLLGGLFQGLLLKSVVSPVMAMPAPIEGLPTGSSGLKAPKLKFSFASGAAMESWVVSTGLVHTSFANVPAGQFR